MIFNLLQVNFKFKKQKVKATTTKSLLLRFFRNKRWSYLFFFFFFFYFSPPRKPIPLFRQAARTLNSLRTLSTTGNSYLRRGFHPPFLLFEIIFSVVNGQTGFAGWTSADIFLLIPFHGWRVKATLNPSQFYKCRYKLVKG